MTGTAVESVGNVGIHTAAPAGRGMKVAVGAIGTLLIIQIALTATVLVQLSQIQVPDMGSSGLLQIIGTANNLVESPADWVNGEVLRTDYAGFATQLLEPAHFPSVQRLVYSMVQKFVPDEWERADACGGMHDVMGNIKHLLREIGAKYNRPGPSGAPERAPTFMNSTLDGLISHMDPTQFKALGDTCLQVINNLDKWYLAYDPKEFIARKDLEFLSKKSDIMRYAWDACQLLSKHGETTGDPKLSDCGEYPFGTRPNRCEIIYEHYCTNHEKSKQYVESGGWEKCMEECKSDGCTGGYFYQPGQRCYHFGVAGSAPWCERHEYCGGDCTAWKCGGRRGLEEVTASNSGRLFSALAFLSFL